MIHPLGKINDNCRLSYTYPINTFVRMQIQQDINEYNLYLLGRIEDLDEEQLNNVETLGLLFDLGFPKDEPGTYLFKNMVLKARRYLGGSDDYGDKITSKDLVNLVESPFSQFYMDLAVYDSDIGIKTFHSYIEESLKKVNYSKVENSLLTKVYSKYNNDNDYGIHSLIIANFLNSNYKNKQKVYSLVSGT